MSESRPVAGELAGEHRTTDGLCRKAVQLQSTPFQAITAAEFPPRSSGAVVGSRA
jgi:hypothetical protein